MYDVVKQLCEVLDAGLHVHVGQQGLPFMRDVGKPAKLGNNNQQYHTRCTATLSTRC